MRRRRRSLLARGFPFVRLGPLSFLIVLVIGGLLMR